jgi:hypothetical protein
MIHGLVREPRSAACGSRRTDGTMCRRDAGDREVGATSNGTTLESSRTGETGCASPRLVPIGGKGGGELPATICRSGGRASSRSRVWPMTSGSGSVTPSQRAAASSAFCNPGIFGPAKARIDKKGADVDSRSMACHLGVHLCRCKRYVKVLDAIDAVAKRECMPRRSWWLTRAYGGVWAALVEVTYEVHRPVPDLIPALRAAAPVTLRRTVTDSFWRRVRIR